MSNTNTKKLLQGYLKYNVDEKLLDFVAENAPTVLFSSMEHICRKAGVSEVAFCAFLAAFGTDSFLAFKDVLRGVLYQESKEQGVAKRSISSIVEELVDGEIRNLSTLARSMDYEQLDRLTREILQAGEVLVLGSSGAAPYALYLTRMLNLLGIKAISPGANDSILSFLSSHDRSVPVIAFGIARYSKQAVLQLRSLRQRGYRIVSFTDRHDSPYVDLSDYYFFMPLNCFDFLDSYTAGMTLINALLSNIGLQDEQKLITQLRARDASLEGMDWLF